MGGNKASDMHLHVKIKKEEEDSVLYISCGGHETMEDENKSQLDGKLDDVTCKTESSEVRIMRPLSLKTKQYKHRLPAAETPKFCSRLYDMDYEPKYSCIESIPCRTPKPFCDRLLERKMFAREERVVDWHVEKRFKCEYCKSKFTRRSSLNRHIECIHREIKAFECDICLENFSTRTIRDRHRDCHFKADKLYRCTICEKAFLYPEMLVRHMNWHRRSEETGEFDCPHCDVSFSSADFLNGHMHNFHSIGLSLSARDKDMPCKPLALHTSGKTTELVSCIGKVYSIFDRVKDKIAESDGEADALSTKGRENASPHQLGKIDGPRNLSPHKSRSSSRSPPDVPDSNSSSKRGEYEDRNEDSKVVCTSAAHSVGVKGEPVFRGIGQFSAPSEVRTKSSLKRKLLYSLAARREGSCHDAKRKNLGCAPAFGHQSVMAPMHRTVRLGRPFSGQSYRACPPTPSLFAKERESKLRCVKVASSPSFRRSALPENVCKLNSERNFGSSKPYIEDRDVKTPASVKTSEVNGTQHMNGSVHVSPVKDRYDENRDFDEVYECPKCGKDYQACRYMETHLLLHDDLTDMPCRFCLKKFISKKDLEKHVHTKHTTKQRLQKKIGSHSNQTLKADVEEINRVLNSAENAASDHHKLESDFKNAPADDADINSNHDRKGAGSLFMPLPGKAFECAICALVFGLATELEQHIAGHFPPKPFRCAVCGDTFPSITLLQRHVFHHNRFPVRETNGQKPKSYLPGSILRCESERNGDLGTIRNDI